MADDEMVAWLSATLDAIEEAARESHRIGATWRADGHEVIADTGRRVVADAYGNAGMQDTDMVHIALHDPRAVLARVDAERAALILHGDQHECSGSVGSADWPPAPCDTLRLLAYGHRFDAPGFRTEWSPQ